MSRSKSFPHLVTPESIIPGGKGKIFLPPQKPTLEWIVSSSVDLAEFSVLTLGRSRLANLLPY